MGIYKSMPIKKILICFIGLLFLTACGKITSTTLGSDGGSTGSPPIIVSLETPVPMTGYAPVTINFSAVVTDSDTSAEELVYLWDFGDGTTSNLASPAHRYTYAGEFTYSLKVYDNKGLYAVKEAATPLVLTGNKRPVITEFSVDRVTADVGAVLSFYARTSDEDLLDTLSYSLDFGDQIIASGQFSALREITLPHAYSAVQIYEAVLKVSDPSGAFVTASVKVGIGCGLPPVISAINWTPLENESVPATVNFSAVVSDADGTIGSYLWEFGDGTTSNDTAPQHIFTVTGTYSVRLTVYDNDGLADFRQESIIIGLHE